MANEIRQFLRDHGISEVEAIIPDMAGIARGKIMPSEKFGEEEGMRLPESIFLQTVTGDYPPDTDKAMSPAEIDITLKADAKTVRRVPWAAEPTAQVIHDCYYADGRRVGMAPVQFAQIVHETARADHQHAFVAQRRERAADRHVLCRIAVRHHRQRHHRDVGLRIHAPQWHPHAVVEPVVLAHARGQSRLRQALRDRLREVRRTRRRIAQFVQRRREAAEVVHGPRLRGAADERRFAGEMRRRDDDRLRPRQLAAQGVEEATGGGILHGQHRRAVGEEQAGKSDGSVHSMKLEPDGAIFQAWAPVRCVPPAARQRSSSFAHESRGAEKSTTASIAKSARSRPCAASCSRRLPSRPIMRDGEVPNRKPSPVRAARRSATGVKPPNQIGIARLGSGRMPARSTRWNFPE